MADYEQLLRDDDTVVLTLEVFKNAMTDAVQAINNYQDGLIDNEELSAILGEMSVCESAYDDSTYEVFSAFKRGLYID